MPLPLITLLLAALGLLQETRDPAALAEQILNDGSYQRALPSGEAQPRSATGGRRRRSRSGRDTGPRERDASGGRPLDPGGEASTGRGGSVIAKVLLWVLLGTVVLIVILALIARMRGYHRDVEVRDATTSAEREEPRRAVALPRQPLDDARDLAAAGRYGEAIRLLLHQTLNALRAQRLLRVEPWLTSRDVLRGARLEPPMRASLKALVANVELALFARRAPGETEFERCVREYENLLHAAGAEAS